MDNTIDSIVKFIQSQQSYFILGIISIMLTAACFELSGLLSKRREFKDFKPLIISIGILGTFIGIFCGLWEFDTKDIVGSVPNLLEGLKLAFLTSILGILISAVLSFFETWLGKKTAETSGPPQDSSQTAQNILNELKEGNQKISQALAQIAVAAARIEEGSKQREIAEALRELISKQMEANQRAEIMISRQTEANQKAEIMISRQTEANQKADLITQFIRQSGENAGSYFQQINQSLQNVMQTLSKGATEEIIKALEQVISDFNSNLTEQFGGNFQQLNESVKKMTDWQENYKASVEQMEKGLQKALASIKDSSDYIETFAVNYEKISQTSRDLERILKANDSQIKSMEDGMGSLRNIGEEAGQGVEAVRNLLLALRETLPALENQMKSQLKTSTETLNKTLTGLTDKFRKDYKAYLDKFGELLESLSSEPPQKDYFEKLKTYLEKIIQLLEKLLDFWRKK